MGFRFQKRISILPGVRINLSKSGASLSVGPRGASVTIGKQGTYANLGIPGSGLSYRERLDKPQGRTRSKQAERLEMPDQLSLELQGDEVVIMRPEGRPLETELIPRAKTALKEDIRDFLNAQAEQRNHEIESLGKLHRDIPRGTGNVKGQVSGKPQANQYPDHQSFMDALMRWRADQANNGPSESDLTDAVLERLGCLAWPAETNIGLKLESGRLLLDVDLPEIEDMPTEEWKAVQTRMALETKPRSQKDIAANYLEHVCSVIVRLIGHSFSIAPEISSVAISAYTTRQKATGQYGEEYVATVDVARTQWLSVDLSNIDQINPQQLLRYFGAAIATDTRGKLLVQQPLI